jgi:isocitrate/isopropylmalate dehydrogenase
MSTNVPITVAHGDGIGPEIMEASLHSIQEAGALLGRVLEQGFDIVKTETLRTYNGAAGRTLSQGQ